MSPTSWWVSASVKFFFINIYFTCLWSMFVCKLEFLLLSVQNGIFIMIRFLCFFLFLLNFRLRLSWIKKKSTKHVYNFIYMYKTIYRHIEAGRTSRLYDSGFICMYMCVYFCIIVICYICLCTAIQKIKRDSLCLSGKQFKCLKFLF